MEKPKCNKFVNVATPKHTFKDFKINSHGEIIDLRTRLPMKGHHNMHGYIQVKLSDPDHSEMLLVHRLVAFNFVPFEGLKPRAKSFLDAVKTLTVNHKLGNKLDNRHSELEWMTLGENTSHAHRIGLKEQTGVQNTSSKYTEDQIHAACQLILDGKRNRDVAETTGLGATTVSDIRNLRNWTHISGEYFSTIIKSPK